MRGISGWHYRPYIRLHEIEKAALPYICRIAPYEDSFEFEWFDHGAECDHELCYRKYCSTDEWHVIPVKNQVVVVGDLDCDMDYEFKIRRYGISGESDIRLVRTCSMPYTVVNYLHPEDKIYSFAGHAICSPTIVKLPSGRLIAGMDLFGKEANRNLSLLFKSDDNGVTWRYLCDIFPSFWPKLFVHKGALYLFSASCDYGDMMIGRSDDEGETWTAPVRLIPGCGLEDMGPHKGVMPIISHKGRLWTGIDYGNWKYNTHSNGLLSIDENADLMNPVNWQYTPFLHFDEKWEGAPVGSCPGCIEGNAVVGPDGIIRNYLRIDHGNCVPSYGKSVILKGNSDDPEAPLCLDRIVDNPVGSNSKFQMMYDEVSGKYIGFGNERGLDIPCRTVMSMVVSEDFYNWRVVKRIFDYRHADPEHVAFQYPDWYIDGEDIVFVSRTAFGRSYNYHDSNYITFHRLEKFRQYL